MGKTDIEDGQFIDCNSVMKIANAIDDENEKAFKKLEDELIKTQKQYEKVVEQNKLLQSEGRTYKTVLEETKDIVDKHYCKYPEECIENKPNLEGELYGCNPNDEDLKGFSICAKKLASYIKNKINEVIQ